MELRWSVVLYMVCGGVASAVAGAGSALAQTAQVAQAGPMRARPQLMVTPAGAQPIRLQSLKITTFADGGMAQTTLRMVFFNPNSRALEGTLQFPLLPGQQLTGFALDVEGQMRPAVPVTKAKGRQILEAVERRGVDPGLLEQTQGNNFQLRIYPVMAHGVRTVELTYSEALRRDGADWVYRLPLAYGTPEQGIEWRVAGAGLTAGGNSTTGAGLMAGGGFVAPPRASGVLGELAFERRKDDDSYIAQLTPQALSGLATDGALTLRLPAATAPQAAVQGYGGEAYFMAAIPVSTQRTPRALPKVVGLLWDSSGSGIGRAREAELFELDRYFKALGSAEVRLVRLRDRPEAAVRYRIVDGNWDTLRAALQATVYDGASALADWQPQPDVGEYLLVSDGLINYGARRFPALKAGQRLYALNSALSSDSPRLAAWADSTGGRLVQLRPEQPGAAARELLTDGPQVRVLRAAGASEVLVDGADAAQGLVRLAGKLTAPRAQLTLSVQQQGQWKEQQLEVVAQPGAQPDRVAGSPGWPPLAAQLWAGLRLRQLEVDFESNRGAIRRIGEQFGMPTRETSLLVLERMTDYVDYDVAPPPQFQTVFDGLKAMRTADLGRRRARQLDSVVRQFQQKQAWWEHDYPRDPAPPRFKTGAARPGTMPDGTDVAGTVANDATSAWGSPVAPPPPAARRPQIPAPAPAPAPAAMPASAPLPLMTYAPEARAGLSFRSDKAMAAPAQESNRIGISIGGAPRAEPAPQIGMALKSWSADAPYIARIKTAGAAQLYAVYLDEKPSYVNSSGFYLDVADRLFELGQRDLALRVLSNLAEMDLENRQVLRILGYRLMQAGAPQLALPVFEKVRELAEEEPQTFRDLGLAQAAAGHPQQAIDMLYEVVTRPWDARFAEIELIALADLNAIVAHARPGTLDTSHIDARLLKNMPLDLRVVLSWDADNSDMDLWVTDPNGERCFYGHRHTRQGGRNSLDFTGGYGPEEFSLHRAIPGVYRVEVNYFGTSQQVVSGATTLQVRLASGFGTAASKEQMVTLRLGSKGETVLVGEFEVRPPAR